MLQTNRDLYTAILALCESKRDDERTLEAYLLALLGLAQRHAQEESITLDQLLTLLTDAFAAEPLAFDPRWRETTADMAHASGFERWRACAIAQIVDLREMDESGALTNQYRYFGIDAPRGGRWYNFDPATYLECATVGAFGGWEPEDEGGRGFVPGDVAAIAPDGSIVSADPEEIERPIVSIASVDWATFVKFLWMGQHYE